MSENKMKPFISTFTPSLTDPEILEKIFVQRQQIAKDTVARIKQSATTDEKHHHLFVGPRGSGKTHLVSILHHRLVNDKKLDKKLRIAWLNEDESAASYPLLLTRIYRALMQKYPNEFAEERLVEARKNANGNHKAVFENLIMQDLNDHVLLVIIENLDDVFKGIESDGQWSFRAFVQNTGQISLLVTTPQLSDDIKDRESAFFGFFNATNLKPLSVEEAQELLIHIAKTKKDQELVDFLKTDDGLARVKAIHQLAGGSHRVFIIMGELISKKSFDNLVQPFMEMLDEMTPYYQERMKNLPPRQRSIVELLSQDEHNRNVTQIAEEIMISNGTAASELKKLLSRRYVEKEKHGKETYYWLAEPLMKMCIQIKNGNDKTIPVLIDFLVIWYDQELLFKGIKALSNKSFMEKKHLTRAFKRKYYERIFLDYKDKKINKFSLFHHVLMGSQIYRGEEDPRLLEYLQSVCDYEKTVVDTFNRIYSVGYIYKAANDKSVLLKLDSFERKFVDTVFTDILFDNALSFYESTFKELCFEIDFTKE